MTRALRIVVRAGALVVTSAAAVGADPMPAPPVLPTPPPHIAFSGGDGSSCRRAVVIGGASHEPEGVRAERWWIFSKHPGVKIDGQTTSSVGGRDFDSIEMLLPDGTRRSICFDITSFYGKP
jgi:hypothetical protein